MFLNISIRIQCDRNGRDRKPPPAGSDYGLRPTQGQSRFSIPTIPFLYPEYKIRNISIFYSLEFYFSQRAGEERISLHRPGLSLRDRAKVVFSAPSIPFCIYHLYKFRELSSFYLQNYFPQRTGEGRYIFIYLSPKLY